MVVAPQLHRVLRKAEGTKHVKLAGSRPIRVAAGLESEAISCRGRVQDASCVTLVASWQIRAGFVPE